MDFKLPNCKIRIAHKEDINLLEDLCKKTFLESYHYNLEDENVQLFFRDNFDPEVLEKEIEGQDISYLICNFEGQDIGYAKINRRNTSDQLSETNILQLDKLYLFQKMLGKKLGLQFLHHIENLAKKENFKKIWLIVWQDNTRAIKFYRKYGFKITGFHNFKMGKDTFQDILMEKEL